MLNNFTAEFKGFIKHCLIQDDCHSYLTLTNEKVSKTVTFIDTKLELVMVVAESRPQHKLWALLNHVIFN